MERVCDGHSHVGGGLAFGRAWLKPDEVMRMKRMGGLGAVAEWVSGEPFRVFFVTGVLASVGAVALWPVYYLGWLGYAPGIPHARVMVEGFLGGFIIGFLGTALPRMLEAPALTRVEAIGFLMIHLAAIAAHLAGWTVAGDGLFLVLLVGFVVCLGVRWFLLGGDAPPPGFALAGFGVLCAIVGVVALLVAPVAGFGVFWRRFSHLLLYQGFALLPLLGVGGFLFRRFLPSGAGSAPSGGAGVPGGMASVVLVALFVVVSFVVEAAGHAGWGGLLRLLVVVVWFSATTRLFRRTRTPGTLVFALRAGVIFLVTGMAAGALWPHLRIGVEHIVLVTGFGLLALTVATRIALGHSGREDLFFAKLLPMKVLLFFLVLGMATRVSADFLPHIMVSHHNYAAACWIIGVLTWIAWIGPSLMRPDPEDEAGDQQATPGGTTP